MKQQTNYYVNRSLELLKKAVNKYPNIDISNVTIEPREGKKPVFVGLKCTIHGELKPYETNRLSLFTGCRHCNKEAKTKELANKPKVINYTDKRVATLFQRISTQLQMFDKAVKQTKVRQSSPLYGVKKGSKEWNEYCGNRGALKTPIDTGLYGDMGTRRFMLQHSSGRLSYIGLYRLHLTSGQTILKLGLSNPLPHNKSKYHVKDVEVLIEFHTASKTAALTDMMVLSLSKDRVDPINLSIVKARSVRNRYNCNETYADTSANVDYLSSLLKGVHSFALTID